MTWNQLAYEISQLPPEKRRQDVTVYVRGVDEFYPVTDQLFVAPPEEDIINPGDAYLQV